MYDTLSGTEFSTKIDEGDEQCNLAQALYQEDHGVERSITNTQDSMRFSYLEKAQHLIAKLAKHNLYINHWKDKA